MPLTRRTQILLEADQHDRLRRRAEESGRSVGAIVREAIENELAEPGLGLERQRAAEVLLSAEPIAVEDWTEMKEEMLGGIWTGEQPAEPK